MGQCVIESYWKQWRGPRTRIANLRKMGVQEDEAVTHGCSSKGQWVISSSRAVHEALSIEHLTSQGNRMKFKQR